MICGKLVQEELVQKQSPEMFYKKAALQSCYFIKKETPTQVFSCEHRKIFYRTSPVAASALFSVNQIAEITAQKMKFSIKDFFSKCNQNCRRNPQWKTSFFVQKYFYIRVNTECAENKNLIIYVDIL